MPVPWDESHVFYVWFDALLNYYTALTYARPGEDLREEFWPASYHLIAKDILKFHCVFWPALLMAADLPLPEHVFVHGYLLMEGHKMSKSLGNVLDPFAVIETYGADALRFYLLRDVSFGQDGSVSTADFEKRYESELANDFGNLASRTIEMVAALPRRRRAAGRARPAVVAEFDGLAERVGELRRPCRADAGARGDLGARAPAQRATSASRSRGSWPRRRGAPAELDQTLATLVEGLRV